MCIGTHESTYTWLCTKNWNFRFQHENWNPRFLHVCMNYVLVTFARKIPKRNQTERSDFNMKTETSGLCIGTRKVTCTWLLHEKSPKEIELKIQISTRKLKLQISAFAGMKLRAHDFWTKNLQKKWNRNFRFQHENWNFRFVHIHTQT